MKNSFRITCIQTKPKACDYEFNISNMEKQIENVMQLHPDTELVVFPELAVTGYECGEAFASLGETEEGPSAKRLGKLAEKFGLHIVFGLPLWGKEDGILYNSQLLIGPDGKVIGRYDKVHLFDTEKRWFTPGKSFPVYETALGKIGLFICYDTFFPECARSLAVKGAEILVNSTNWEDPYAQDMVRMMTARALENICFLACCNRVGRDDVLSFFGLSRIIDPRGNVIAAAAEGEADICTAVVTAAEEEGYRHGYYTMLEERRPELYGALV